MCKHTVPFLDRMQRKSKKRSYLRTGFNKIVMIITKTHTFQIGKGFETKNKLIFP